MANLISPGVQVTITDESFFIPASASTVPLIFIATEDEKLQPDGNTIASGTLEYGVVRTITSRKQALDLYGIPNFLEDSSGNPHHGDARNEYGLFALHNYLAVGDRAFVVRANVNLNDNIIDIRAMWNAKIQESAILLENLTQAYINEYNATYGYILGDASSGFQDVDYTNPITNTDITTVAAGTYDFQINVDVGGFVTVSIVLVGGETYQDVLDLINLQLVNASVSIANGNLRFSANSSGFNSSVALNNGTTLDLFAALPGFVSFATAVNGEPLFKQTVTSSELISLTNEATLDVFKSFSFSSLSDEFYNDVTTAPLSVYANGYEQAETSTFIGYNGILADWVTNLLGSFVQDEFLPAEGSNLLIAAADDFQYTKDFKNNISLGANDDARRGTITTALQAAINSNDAIRSENFEYNLILCPGYPEVVDEMISLAESIKEEAFVIADTPFNMNASEVVAWANTTERFTSVHIAYYYPHAIASNINGKNIFVSASSLALRTYAYNDEVAELWFAPAGLRRGLVTGISNVGYVSGQLGSPTTFEELHLNQGQRDDLYKYFTNLNPITFFPGRGIVVWGQKTSAPAASAMDRVNVSRLMKYIKRMLRKHTLSFVFQPNDQITRDNLKALADDFLGELIVKRGLYDAVTICDTSNNTPDRIDRNELYLDIALKPVKAAEFIYIPIRIVNTGDDI